MFLGGGKAEWISWDGLQMLPKGGGGLALWSILGIIRQCQVDGREFYEKTLNKFPNT